MAVMKPSPSGANPAGGRSARSRPLSARSSHSCATNPSAAPISEATTAITSSCTSDTVSVNIRLAPKVLSSATESRCRCT